MAYEIKSARSVEKQLDRVPPDHRLLLVTRLRSLATRPRGGGAKKLQDAGGMWELRSGEYRALYLIDDSAAVVRIVWVGHRRDLERAVRGLH